MSLIPEGSCKSVTQVLCVSVLILGLLQPMMEIDFDSYAYETARVREVELAFAEKAAASGERLNYLVIQNEYQEYILDKANEQGIEKLKVNVGLRWYSEGLWVPYSVELNGEYNGKQKQTLSNIMQDDLGIPKERQNWEDG